MVRIGSLVLVCAAGAMMAGPLAVFADPKAPDTPIASTLAVQTALQQGRFHLVQGDAKSAVEVLEAQLSRINGNREYLLVLRDAYRGYVRDLYLARQDALAQKYLERLCILDPSAAKDKSLTAVSPADKAKVPGKVELPETPLVKTVAAPVKPPANYLARGKIEMSEPKLPPPKPTEVDSGKRKLALDLVAQAEEAFGKKDFDKAGSLWEKAYAADAATTEDNKECWAYCKLHHAVEALKKSPVEAACLASLEGEVLVALAMAPQLQKSGKWLLAEIRERRKKGAEEPSAPGLAEVVVQHLEQKSQGWSVSETTNFRIFHRESKELAEKAARTAEVTRTSMQTKWFGKPGANWNPKCEVFLHATGEDYSRITSKSPKSPGHSRFELEGGRILTRRIHLNCEQSGGQAITAVLPHEATHVVLAGEFGDDPLPRWADEGMAVLSEPSDRIDQIHRRNLTYYRQQKSLFSVRELMEMPEYPAASRINAFYAQSVSLVDYLTRQRGAVVFAQFMRDGMRGGYEAALKKHYGCKGYRELQERWTQATFTERTDLSVRAGSANR
jgi:hypothetical protein